MRGQLRITRLMTQGRWLRAYPLACKYLIVNNQATPKTAERLQFVVIAQKKIYRHAVDRNRCKRLIREALRLNAQQLRQQLNSSDSQMQVALFYVSKTIEPYHTVEKAIKKLVQQLTNNIQQQ